MEYATFQREKNTLFERFIDRIEHGKQLFMIVTRKH